MDASTKAVVRAVVLLWQYNNLLERENREIGDRVDAIENLILRYLRDAKIDEKQHPETTAALFEALRSAESGASNMKGLRQDKLKTKDAIQKVFMDLAIDPAATLQ